MEAWLVSGCGLRALMRMPALLTTVRSTMDLAEFTESIKDWLIELQDLKFSHSTPTFINMIKIMMIIVYKLTS